MGNKQTIEGKALPPEPTTEELLAKALANPETRAALHSILKKAAGEPEPPIHVPSFLRRAVKRHGIKRVSLVVGLSIPTISRLCAEIETLGMTLVHANHRIPDLQALDRQADALEAEAATKTAGAGR
jgi:hypothetical protein